MKAILASLVLIVSASTLIADSYSTFSSVVNFSASLKDLVQSPNTISSKLLYLIEGTIRDVRVQKSEAGFYAEADFVDSEWQGLEDIKTYKIVLIFAKDEFASRVPDKPNRTNPTFINPNSRGLALVQYVRSVPGENGDLVPVFLVQEYRVLR